MLIFIIGLVIWGFIVGALARLALPRPDPMPWYATSYRWFAQGRGITGPSARRLP